MRRLILLLALLIIPGCTAASGFPKRTQDLQQELEPLKSYFTEDVLAGFETAVGQSPDAARRYRDRVTHARMRAIDIHYAIFIREVTGGRIAFNSATDIAVIGLSAAGAITGASSTKSILAAISGGIVGSRGVIDKEVFYEKTLPVIIQAMEAGRKAERVRILAGLSSAPGAYTMGQALADVENYYHAGTFVYAINRILDTTGAEAKKSDQKIDDIYQVRYNPVVRADRDVLRDWLDPERTSEQVARDRIAAFKQWLTTNNLNPENHTAAVWIESAAPTEITRAITFINSHSPAPTP